MSDTRFYPSDRASSKHAKIRRRLDTGQAPEYTRSTEQDQPLPVSQMPPLPQNPAFARESDMTEKPEAPVTPEPRSTQRQERAFPPRFRWRRRHPGCLGGGLGCLALLIVLFVVAGPVFSSLQHFFNITLDDSLQTLLNADSGFMSSNARTNVLLMGYGGGSHDGAYLTDSIVIVSLLPQSHHTSVISIPRDLWVQYPVYTGQYTKINTVYQSASNADRDPQAGGVAADQMTSLLTGLDVHYWVTIDFDGFKKVIDTIGGVDVPVANAFDACYPRNDDASKDASWMKVQFNKGMQHMDGARAIIFARAREPLESCGMGTSENLSELNDFGRSARQQLLMKVMLAKARQKTILPHLYNAMQALQRTIHTNMSVADLAAFALKTDLNDPKAAHIGLSDQNVLIDGQSTDGQYILQPENDDWNTIRSYIQQHLYT